MKIIHLIETLDPSGGGVPSAVKSLVEEQVRQGHDINVISCHNNFNKIDSSTSSSPRYFNLDEFESNSQFKFFSSITTWQKIFALLRPDVCHLHGIWTPTFVFASKVLYKRGIPNIVSPHGQLKPSLIQSDNFLKKIKKNTYLKIFATGILERASLIHAVCQAEADTLARIVKRQKIRVIYNFIDDIFFNFDLKQKYNIQIPSEIKIITFIGRVERRKGIANLVEAFCTSTLSDKWKLQIVGPIYEKKLAKWIVDRAQSAGLGKAITVTGPIYGEDRINAYLDSFAVCLPSFSEVVGLVNIEAALLGKLVITTPYAGINEIENHGGIVCDNNINVLRTMLNNLQNLSTNEYLQRCESLQKWSKETFSRELLSEQWEEVIRCLCRNKNDLK